MGGWQVLDRKTSECQCDRVAVLRFRWATLLYPTQDRPRRGLPGLCYAGGTRFVRHCQRYRRCLLILYGAYLFYILAPLVLRVILQNQGVDQRRAIEGMTGQTDIDCLCFSCNTVSCIDCRFSAQEFGLLGLLLVEPPQCLVFVSNPSDIL